MSMPIDKYHLVLKEAEILIQEINKKQTETEGF